jgi:hypothetical protein
MSKYYPAACLRLRVDKEWTVPKLLFTITYHYHTNEIVWIHITFACNSNHIRLLNVPDLTLMLPCE